MQFVDIDQAINADGLRLILVKGMPSAWGQAAKAMMEYKGLEFIVAPQQPGGPNPELVAWSGENSGPVVAWNDEQPINRWNDILVLLERLAPQTPVVPEDPTQRIQLFGISHEICGELGLGWNRRLDMMRPPASSTAPSEFARKYGYRDADAALANSRVVGLMQYLAAVLKAQKKVGSGYLIGQSITAADFYWAAFSNFVAIQPHEECPLDPGVRVMFENTCDEVASAIDPILMEHRDRIMRKYFRMPMEF